MSDVTTAAQWEVRPGFARALIFGSGRGGQEALSRVMEEAHVMGFLDNDTARQATTVLGYPVYPPAALRTMAYDCVYIASIHAATIRQQLMSEFGIPDSRIRFAPGLGATEPTPVPTGVAPTENRLTAYLERGYDEIPGWLWRPAVDATLALARMQQGFLEPGPVCEIGVWEGRYLTLLSFLAATARPVLGIDPFIHSGNRDEQLGRLRHNIAKFARRPDLVTLFERDSRGVTPDEILAAVGARCQFVSVDGDHTLEGALLDLSLAEAILAPGGIVSVDDVPNMSCPGVTEAVVRYGLLPAAALAPFLHVSNKLFLTQREHCHRYRQEILTEARAGLIGAWGRQVIEHHERMAALGVPVRFMGEDLLVAA